MQKWTPSIQGQLNDLPGFPARPNTNPPADDRWELGEWIDETRVRPAVADVASLPLTGNELGDARIVDADTSWYYWNGLAWVPMGTGGVGPILSVTGVAPINATPGPNPIVSHDASGVVAGTYGNGVTNARVTVDAKGHVTNATTVPIAFPAAPIQSVTGTAPINVTAGANPVVSHNNSGAVAGTYGDAANVPQVTVDAKGHVTAATTVPIFASPISGIILSTGPIQTISANTDQITPVALLHRIQTNGVNHTLSSTPTINLPGAVIGQVQFIQNVDTTGRHVTFQRGVAQGLSMSNASKQLDPGGTFMFIFNGSLWVEVIHTQSTTT